MEKQFDYDIYSLSSYDYYLPEELIAQSPSEKRDESRLLTVNREDGTIKDEDKFFKIEDYLYEGDVLVRNNTKVIPARLFATKKETNGHCEVLLLKEDDKEKDLWTTLVGNAHIVKEGTVLTFGDDKMKAVCKEVKDEGIRVLKFIYQGIFLENLEEIGKMPLPPYIHSQLLNNDRYQTVYAKISGSAAAPTAGFHFTDELFERLKKKNVEIAEVTLNIGLGTFRPVKKDDIRLHNMHSERCMLDEKNAEILSRAKKEKRRIIPVGTTSLRTIESIYQKYSCFKPTVMDTSLFIYPGFDFKASDALITNFHLPKSTLLMLICAFASRDLVLKAYNHAVENKYRFVSFGDSMFIY